MKDVASASDTVLDTSDKDQADQAFDTPADAVETLDDADENNADPDNDNPTDEHPDHDAQNETDLDVDDELLVTLGDGNELPLGELKRGYFRNKDYTRKTEALAQERRAVNAMRETYDKSASALETAYQSLASFVDGLIPAPPDPALAQTNPEVYESQQAVHIQARAELAKLLDDAENFSAQMRETDQQLSLGFVQQQRDKLFEAMPHLTDPDAFVAFDAANVKTAREFGFSDAEISSAADHRLMQLVHYARIGKQAEHNRKNAGRRLAEKPSNGSRPNRAGSKLGKNRNAMKRLNEMGSLEAALAVEFD